MTTIIVTNEFVQLIDHYRSFGHISKEAPQFRLFKKRRSRFKLIYVKAKDLSSPKCHKVEKDT